MALNFQGRHHGALIVYLGNVDKSLHPEAVTNTRSSAIVLASKNKSRKKNVEDDVAAYTTAALPLLEEYAAGYSVAVLEKKKDLSSNLGAKETLQREKSSSKKSSLEEFLKGKVRPLDEDEEKEEKEDERVEVWEGDLSPMTAEEERRLLAQLRRSHRCSCLALRWWC
ncbi:hypothetical protein SELMODRAFT_425835 [Selaginella moellendorffii]|uniref:Uncharacterized protein n=1 Tax=Selaginella moellendorffii TaxID=88036 RepID=D8SUG1_SELML|nr:hypothetical protein SELMODRAFT_425835 [Selaginella moellendorffii]